MKKCVLLTPLLFLFFNFQAQSTFIDSLQREAFHQLHNDLEKSKKINQRALELSEQESYSKGSCEGIRLNALILKEKGKYLEAYQTLTNALSCKKKLKDQHEIWEIEADFVALEGRIGRYDLAISKGFEIIEKASIAKDHYILSKAYNNISNAYDNLNDIDQALQFSLLSVEESKKSKNDLLLLISKHNLANRYQYLGEYAEARKYYNEVLELSSKLYKKDLEAGAYDGIANCYFEQEDYINARQYFEEAKAIHLEMVDSIELSVSCINLGYLEELQGNYEKALEYYQQSEAYLQDKGGLETQYDLVRVLSDGYANVGNYEKASEYYQKQTILSDSLYDEGVINAIEETEGKYQVKELKETQLRQKYVITIISLVLAFATIALFFLSYYYRQSKKIHELDKRQMELEVKEKERAHKEELEQIFEEQEKKFMDAVLRQEKINNAASQKLHDHVGNTLLSVVWSMEDHLEAQKKNPLTSTFLEKTNKLLYDIYEEVRTVSHRIRENQFKEEHLLTFDQSEAVATQELVGAVKDLYDKISGKRLQARVYTSGDVRPLDSTIEIKAYRIIQELTSNILKHAQANKVELQLNYLEDELQIVMEDDGIGFHPEESQQKGIGLHSVTTTIQALEGKLEIDTGKGGGTTIMIDLPASIQKVA